MSNVVSVIKKLREVLNTDIPRSEFTYSFLEHLWRASLFCRAMKQDSVQIIKHGLRAPRFCERVFVDIRKVNFWLPPAGEWWRESGLVLGGDWEQGIEPLDTNRTLTYTKLHWQQGISWLDIREKLLMEGSSGISEFAVLEYLGSSSESKRKVAAERLASYENLYTDVSVSREFKSRSELPVPHFREHGGILVHFDSKGQLIFGARGNHRFAIAKILELPVVPVMVGLIHPNVKDSWRDSTVWSQ